MVGFGLNNSTGRPLDDRKLFLLTMAVVVAAMTWTIYFLFPEGVDWSTAFRPAVWRLLRGEALYGVAVEGHFYLNAPWALLPLLPLAVLPVKVGRILLIVASLTAFIFTARKLGARPLSIGLLVLSPPVLHGLLNANIDWLAVIGFVLPPQIGLFFISTKPQIGLAVGLYWLYDIWRQQGLRAVLRTFAPFTAALLLSFAIWGFWPAYFGTQVDLWWNASFWPASLPVGLGLLVAAIRKREIRYAIGASPCFSPYVLFHSWVGAELAVVHRTPEMIAVFVGLWGWVVLRAVSLGI